MKILILNGPNLNLLGAREPEIYGTTTLAQIEQQCRDAVASKASIEFKQSNDEAELINWVQQADAEAMIINAAAYTHSSIALHDALKSYYGRIIEVHLSNPMARESFRHTSYVSPLAEAILCGFGARGYVMALDYLTA